MADPAGDGYLELLVQTLERTRRLLHRGGLSDPDSQREIATLELEVAVAQLRKRAAQRSTQILMLPSTDALRRLTQPVRDEAQRLRAISAATRARSAELRSVRRVVGA